MSVVAIQKELRRQADPVKAKFFPRFFKSGKGEYGEGDKFLGVTVPRLRIAAKQFQDLSINQIKELLASSFHEERLVALLILVRQYQRGDELVRQKIFDFYLSQTKRINNWDLVDTSAYHIVGTHLLNSDWSLLKKLAKSKSLWERRISMVATLAFIRKGNLKPTFEIAKLLLQDEHDLMHKAVGWMLREAGKKDAKQLSQFFKTNMAKMPRTALRYAIEKYPLKQRQNILLYGIIKAD